VSFDANQLLLSLLVSSVGFVLFMYGKKQARLPQLAIGIVMSLYPYFVSNLWLMAGIAIFCIAACWLLVRVGF
jgi:hypothetical protein